MYFYDADPTQCVRATPDTVLVDMTFLLAFALASRELAYDRRPRPICCQHHNYLAHMRTHTKLFSWVRVTGYAWSRYYIEYSLREHLYRGTLSSSSLLKLERFITSLGSYNYDRVPDRFPVMCRQLVVASYFASELAKIPDAPPEVWWLRPEKAVAISRHLIGALPSEALVFTGVKPPKWYQKIGTWYKVDTEMLTGRPANRMSTYYCHKSAEYPEEYSHWAGKNWAVLTACQHLRERG